jgi:hypothetical protein
VQPPRPLLSSRERPSLQAPPAAATRPDGTVALRGSAATDPDTPARSAAGDRRSAAAPQRLGTCGGPLSPADHHIDLPIQSQREQTSRSRQSSRGVSTPHPSGHLVGTGLDLMLAFLATSDQPDAGNGSVPERYPRAGLGFHHVSRGARSIAQGLKAFSSFPSSHLR